MSKWISVKDRLPEESGYYLVWYSFGETNIGYYNKTNGWYSWDKSYLSHWMPLPEPPESEVEDE